LTFGLVILAMIYTFGEISGAHFNPAVTLGFFAARRFEARHVVPYLGAQFAGAFTASGTLRLLFPTNLNLGATLPAGSELQSFVLETILTFFLMLVILSVSTGAKEKGITAGLVVGSVIGLEAMFAGPICGASMNPARSLAPAAMSGHLEHLWIYLAGPVLGSLLAIPACCGVREPGCCSLSKERPSQP
jgi:aquaporin Z